MEQNQLKLDHSIFSTTQDTWSTVLLLLQRCNGEWVLLCQVGLLTSIFMSPGGELHPDVSSPVIFISINPEEQALDSGREYKPFAYPKLAKHVFWKFRNLRMDNSVVHLILLGNLPVDKFMLKD